MRLYYRHRTSSTPLPPPRPLGLRLRRRCPGQRPASIPCSARSVAGHRCSRRRLASISGLQAYSVYILYMYMYIYICIYVFMYVCTYVCVYVFSRFARICIYKNIFVWDYTIDTIQCCFLKRVNGTSII